MNVKKVIKDRGYTIEQAADILGVTRNTLSVNITGNPTVKTLQRVADAIGCNVGDFFADETAGKVGLVCPHCGKLIKLSIE